ALIPVFYVLAEVVQSSRNVVYWDEFDTALAFVLRLEEGVTIPQFFQQLFAINNEHRMLTSRFEIALTYWLTGTLDFRALSALGNASLIGLCILLVRETGTMARRLRFAVVIGFVVFNFEHYENFLWSGSSIEHFQILLLVGISIIGIARGTTGGLITGAVFAALATFTLAHGVVVWPVGAAMLWQARRRRELAGWGIVAALVLAGFFLGFRVNASHEFAGFSFAGIVAIAHFWLTLLGSVPALNDTTAGPWVGVILVALVGWAAWTGSARRERVLFPLTCFAIGAMALIAVGRAQNAGGLVHSRYLILSALAWASTVFMLLERYSHPRRPLKLLYAALPVLIGFNIAANISFADEADSWVECRDRAAVRFKQHGADGHGSFTLHPQPSHATRLLHEAERRGVYRMASICEPRSFPHAKPSSRISYYIEEMEVNRHAAFVGGWAAIQGEDMERGDLHLVLRSEHRMYVYSTVSVSRPDVVKIHQQPGWLLGGFRFARTRDKLPAGEYQIGVLIDDGADGEYIMTAHRIVLDGEGKALLATAE
ncbi:MAG: hypothetical protein Q7S40_11900, partial [Opitutaceae bacterium]|nr:hypothetical protein [Opitutaceae bacterium]